MDLEKAILEKQSAQIESLFEMAKQELQTTLSATIDWLAKQAKPEIAIQEGAMLDMSQVKRLQTMLAEKNMEACDVYALVRPGLLGRFGMTESLRNIQFFFVTDRKERLPVKPFSRTTALTFV